MNKQIKFRVWTGSKMEYNVMAGFLGAFFVAGMDPNDSACMSPANTIYGKETLVMQFIGLVDKNGKEIYEQDILRYKNPEHPERKHSLHKVIWSQSGCRYLLSIDKDDMETVGVHGVTAMPERWEVIGNTCENPELIK